MAEQIPVEEVVIFRVQEAELRRVIEKIGQIGDKTEEVGRLTEKTAETAAKLAEEEEKGKKSADARVKAKKEELEIEEKAKREREGILDLSEAHVGALKGLTRESRLSVWLARRGAIWQKEGVKQVAVMGKNMDVVVNRSKAFGASILKSGKLMKFITSPWVALGLAIVAAGNYIAQSSGRAMELGERIGESELGMGALSGATKELTWRFMMSEKEAHGLLMNLADAGADLEEILILSDDIVAMQHLWGIGAEEVAKIMERWQYDLQNVSSILSLKLLQGTAAIGASLRQWTAKELVDQAAELLPEFRDLDIEAEEILGFLIAMAKTDTLRGQGGKAMEMLANASRTTRMEIVKGVTALRHMDDGWKAFIMTSVPGLAEAGAGLGEMIMAFENLSPIRRMEGAIRTVVQMGKGVIAREKPYFMMKLFGEMMFPPKAARVMAMVTAESLKDTTRPLEESIKEAVEKAKDQIDTIEKESVKAKATEIARHTADMSSRLRAIADTGLMQLKWMVMGQDALDDANRYLAERGDIAAIEALSSKVSSTTLTHLKGGQVELSAITEKMLEATKKGEKTTGLGWSTTKDSMDEMSAVIDMVRSQGVPVHEIFQGIEEETAKGTKAAEGTEKNTKKPPPGRVRAYRMNILATADPNTMRKNYVINRRITEEKQIGKAFNAKTIEMGKSADSPQP